MASAKLTNLIVLEQEMKNLLYVGVQQYIHRTSTFGDLTSSPVGED
jgi:hypothetical protein